MIKELYKIDETFSIAQDDQTKKYCVLKNNKPLINGQVGLYDLEETAVNSFSRNRKIFEHMGTWHFDENLDRPETLW